MKRRVRSGLSILAAGIGYVLFYSIWEDRIQPAWLTPDDAVWVKMLSHVLVVDLPCFALVAAIADWIWCGRRRTLCERCGRVLWRLDAARCPHCGAGFEGGTE